MSRHHNDYPDGTACFWTSSVVGCVPIFKSPTAAKLLLGLWEKYRVLYGVKILGYVIMPDHFHVVIWSDMGEDTQRFLKRTLSLASVELGKLVERAAAKGEPQSIFWLKVFQSHAGTGSRLAIWKERGRAFPAISGDVLRQKLNYIHENPVRKCLVEQPDDWVFSSASWYTSGSGPMTLDIVNGW